MRILFVNNYAFVPQVVGGIEISTLDLCLALQARGHAPAVLCSIVEGDGLYLWNRLKSKLLRQNFPVDRGTGVPVYRGWSPQSGLAEVGARVRPDAVIVQGGHISSYEIAARSAQLGYRTFYYTHDVGVIVKGTPLPDLRDVRWIANSAFTARTLAEKLDVPSAIVPPLFRADFYRGQATGERVTMVNPRPEKGGDIAVRVAELCPEIPFRFIEAWSAGHPDVERLKARATRLPNVEWMPVQTDMRAVYAASRLLLMPSQVAETWGRVITEAQFRGIPAVASAIGALPETLGPGGIALPPQAPAEEWAAAVRSLYADAGRHAEFSAAAQRYAMREELTPAAQVDTLLQYLQSEPTARA